MQLRLLSRKESQREGEILMMNPKSRDDNSRNRYGSRVRAVCNELLSKDKSITTTACRKAQCLLTCLVLAVTVVVPFGTLLAASPEPIDLGTAANFGALAGAGITGTGDVEGDVGSGAGAIAPAITSEGTIYPTGDAIVTNALADFSTAYIDGKNRPYDVLLSAAAYELGGNTLTQGVYKIAAAAAMTTPLTLDAEGDPNAVFIIQIGAAFNTTAAVGNVILTNGARSANIFWIVEGAVTVGASTHLAGTILGGAAITFGATTTINGRVMAGSVADIITLATTEISEPPPVPATGTIFIF